MNVTDNIELKLGDFFEKVKEVPNKSVDMIWADIPYGVTQCKWDEIWDIETMWSEFNRIARHDRVPMIFTATEPFNVDLINSNRKMFKYSWIWQKNVHSNFLLTKKMPAKIHELVLVFYKKAPIYNSQITEGHKDTTTYACSISNKSKCYGELSKGQKYKINELRELPTSSRYAKSIQKFKIVHNSISRWENRLRHPTEKPVDLIQYFIETYTNPGGTVFDPCFGTGSSAIACLNSDRKYIGVELDKDYYDTAVLRLNRLLNEESSDD